MIIIRSDTKHRAKKISVGEYLYRSFKIQSIGYYEPEHRVAWEGYNEQTGEGVARGFTKRDVMNEIDYFLDKG